MQGVISNGWFAFFVQHLIRSVFSRFLVFGLQKSLERIEKKNSVSSGNARATAKYGLTKFSDLSPEEFEQQYLLRQGNFGTVAQPSESDPSLLRLSASGKSYPAKLDWYEIAFPPLKLLHAATRINRNIFFFLFLSLRRVHRREKNVVTGVKDQGQCGACWAFSVVECAESMNAIKYGSLESLSVQQVITTFSLLRSRPAVFLMGVASSEVYLGIWWTLRG